MGKYIIREAEVNDVSGISDLRKRIKEYKSLESENYDLFWKGLIWDNPCNIRKALVAVDNDGKVLAHYAIAPYRFLREGASMVGGFVCQLMVDEAYRQELIFPKMMSKMLREYKGLGIDFVYSLSSRPEVVKAHQAFGFKKIGDLPVYAKPYSLTRIVHHVVQNRALNVVMKPFLAMTEAFLRIKRSPSKGSLMIREIARFGPEVNQLIKEVQGCFPYAMLKNADILNWRTVDSPLRKYRIITAEQDGVTKGYVIVRRMLMKQFDALAIVDIMFNPDQPDTGTLLLNTVHGMAVDLNTDMTSCLLSPHDPFYPVLKKAGYIRTPESIALFVHGPKGTETGFSEASFNKWHLTWLDHDSM